MSAPETLVKLSRTTIPDTTDLRNLMRPQDYLQGREHVFQSPEALRWFIRMNRDELMRRGAIVAPAGRKMLVVSAFDRAVIEIGAKRAELLAA